MGIRLDLGNEKRDGGTDEQVYSTCVGGFGFIRYMYNWFFSATGVWVSFFFLHGTESGFCLVGFLGLRKGNFGDGNWMTAWHIPSHERDWIRQTDGCLSSGDLC